MLADIEHYGPYPHTNGVRGGEGGGGDLARGSPSRVVTATCRLGRCMLPMSIEELSGIEERWGLFDHPTSEVAYLGPKSWIDTAARSHASRSRV